MLFLLRAHTLLIYTSLPWYECTDIIFRRRYNKDIFCELLSIEKPQTTLHNKAIGKCRIKIHFLAPLRAYVFYGWPLLDSIKVSNRVCLNPTKAGLFWGSKSRGGGGVATSTHHLPFLYFSPNQMKIGRNTHHHVNFHFLSGKDFDCPKFCWREQKISKNMVKTMPY